VLTPCHGCHRCIHPVTSPNTLAQLSQPLTACGGSPFYFFPCPVGCWQRRWEVAPQCQAEWKDFDAASFCDAVTALGGLLLVGDSTSRQMFLSLYNHLVTATPPVVHPPQLVTPVPCKGWEASGSMPTSLLLCHAIWSCRGAGEGPLLFHTRNDRLTLNRRRPLSKNWEFYLPWLPLIKQWGVKVVVLNRGVHYTRSQKFAHQLQKTMAVLRRLHPGLLVVYRASVPGHLDCQNFTAPIREPQGWEPPALQTGAR